jgi:nitroimidazol reductase NimA-like FMN-containing flavoprotein (pyridoxamine 5'-phosphate oxidase superfamily)
MTTPRATPARFPNEYGQTDESRAELQEWEEVATRIAAARNYFLATVGADGRPHLRPVDGVFVEGALCFGGSPETRWVRHLEHQPEASASLPDDDQAVILEGRVEMITDASDPVAVALNPANRAKYPQYFTDDEPGEFQPFWCLRPRRVFAWSLTGFPARATRFDFD